MSNATTGGKVAEGEYEVKDAWDGPEAGRWVRLWREAIIPNLYKIQRGQVVWSPPLHENAIQVIGPIRSAGSRVRVRMPQSEVPAATLVSIYLVNPKRNPDYPRGAVRFRWPKRAELGNPAFGEKLPAYMDQQVESQPSPPL